MGTRTEGPVTPGRGRGGAGRRGVGRRGFPVGVGLAFVGNFAGCFALASGQAAPPPWERRLEATLPPPTLFHAPLAIHLPTAATLGPGEWQFEISHRFYPPLSAGPEAFWGLDGPVNIRIGMGWAPGRGLLVTLARSNVGDNWDFQVKKVVWEGHWGSLPLAVAGLGGVALEADGGRRKTLHRENLQGYSQLILNLGLGARGALGLVPSYLWNARVEDEGMEGRGALGIHGRVGLNALLALEGEYLMGSFPGGDLHPLASAGVELETGGHFFKVFLGNSVGLNPGHVLAGSPFPLAFRQLRLGFTITRLLRF